jgi:hypothetical protein
VIVACSHAGCHESRAVSRHGNPPTFSTCRFTVL